MTVIVVIAILSTMVGSLYGMLREKAERGSCASNLVSLYAAANSYLTDHDSWPQITTADIEGEEYAKQWIAVFQAYHLNRANWVCPTIDKQLGGGANSTDTSRVDYIATPFDAKPSSPKKFATQPWFVERASVHGDGNLLIYASGELRSLDQIVRESKK